MHSMTGYGHSVVSADGRELCMEIRSVNHRYLDLAMRLPRTIGFIEDDIRKMTAEKLSRGHLDIQVTYANHRQDARRVSPDLALARAYKEAIGEIRQALDEPEQSVLREILTMPDVLSVVEGEEDQDAVRGLVRRALEETLGQILIMREAEGRRLAADLMLKVDTLSGIVEAISARAPLVVEEYRTKLHRRLQDLLNGELDESRFQTEVAIFADKDVTVLNVWATFCDPCIREMPDLEKLSEEFPDNVQVVGVVIDTPPAGAETGGEADQWGGDADNIDLARKICTETGVKYTNILASESVLQMLSNVEAVPTTFILDRSGNIISKPFVGADIEGYKKAVEEYLAEQ